MFTTICILRIFLQKIHRSLCAEDEDDSREDSHSYRTVYRYEPHDIGMVLYKKVQENMEQKKASIYKEFKKRYTDEEYLFESARFYKRTRDGKEYYDINVSES